MAEAIRCEGLKKVYGTVRALDGVDLSMPAGSIFGFLGPNGAGKTTTIKILLGLAILDEHSSSLDPIGRRDVIDILRMLRERGISVFYSTHILDDVERVADYVAIMKEGRVVREGAMRDLMAGDRGRYRVTVEAP